MFSEEKEVFLSKNVFIKTHVFTKKKFNQMGLKINKVNKR
jgi:hypothetical protein